MATAPLIEVKNLSVTRDGNPILDRVDFDIKEREYLGIVGPNGGGKTTLLQAMLGLLKPTRGEVKIYGKSAEDPRARESVGYVPQTFLGQKFTFPITVEEVVATGVIHRRFYGNLSKKEWKRVYEKLELVGMKELAKESFHSLSGGERQRVIIARALVGNPGILFLDEPLSAVDQPSQELFYNLLSGLNKKGLTIVLVTHDLDMVAKQVSRVLCLNQSIYLNCKISELSEAHNWSEFFGETKAIHHHAHEKSAQSLKK
jgi:zinc transport system ATP-binding protein